ncbi:MAG: hypothetical protein IT307_18210 [Chloroflexi bacterium]|nr:hypothetical protein [Chloroflexota bacterium]
MPELAAEWDDWDENSQLDFIFDWPISRERLTRVRRLAEAGKLTPEQQTRFEYVLRLVAEHGPTLERLIAD